MAAVRRKRLAETLALEPNIVVVSAAMFLMGLGENLWRRFLPKYLESLGAPIAAIGLFGSAEDFLDGVYQYPGGWIADRYGRRRALHLFVALAAIGYGLFTIMPAWPVAFAALAFVMAWDAMASPTLFAVVGDSLPAAKRTMGFIVDLALPSLRARTVGLYYLIRSLAIAPAAFVGGLLWRLSPAAPFYTAAAIGLVGIVVFVLTVDAEDA